jgi:nicotinate dehydrogenase subunit B
MSGEEATMDGMIERRSLFKAGGGLVVAFALGVSAPRGAGTWTEKPVAADEVDSFLAIDAQGRVTVYSGKVDLGTGVRTGHAQLAADELDVPLRPGHRGRG